MSNFSAARTNMVDCQIHPNGVSTPEVLEAFGKIPRDLFVPESLKKVAYADDDLITGQGRFLLAPVTHARMIQALQPKAKHVALDISNTNGYSAAILSCLVSTVVCVEEQKEHLDQAGKVWEQIDICNIAGFKGSLGKGCPEHAPYDLIFMNGAVAEIPQDLVAQLASGGQLITIVKKPDAVMGDVTLVQSLGEKGFSSYSLFEAAAPYLPGFEPKPAFSFS